MFCQLCFVLVIRRGTSVRCVYVHICTCIMCQMCACAYMHVYIGSDVCMCIHARTYCFRCAYMHVYNVSGVCMCMYARI